MNLRVGIPREIKPMEGRVGLTPSAVAELVSRGAEVAVQQPVVEQPEFSVEQRAVVRRQPGRRDVALQAQQRGDRVAVLAVEEHDPIGPQ